ncbi:hypothetical protein HWV00_11410 [Moritella sp. 24]|uniref:hypothetical protein n=1 Tax=Moritella sp. 24 TaxID=2746230 RepID=UPI001BAB9B2D|nr:hypothetical protein [Moritella sp. 24]QUM76793.1 hypothetical protein HWV00_11410 [Moritella sp. 24]
MKKSILLITLFFSGATFANDSCREISPIGAEEELYNVSISVLGSGDIYANGNMQAEIAIDYKALGGFSFTDITLCDFYEMTPIETDEEWAVEEVGNDYLHEILSSQSSTEQRNNEEDITITDAEWEPYRETRFIRKTNDLPATAEICVVVKGMQSNDKIIAKTSCIGDNMSRVHISAQKPKPIGFELKSDTIRDEKYHLAKVYELHSQSEYVQIHDIQYSNGAVEAISSNLRLNSDSEFYVLRDYQGAVGVSSWVGLWAYDSSKVETIEHINEDSDTVGSFDLSIISPPSTPSLVTSFLLYQMHEEYYMIADKKCIKNASSQNVCVNYQGDNSIANGESDRRANELSITDFYGTTHSLSLKFGTGNDDDDLVLR